MKFVVIVSLFLMFVCWNQRSFSQENIVWYNPEMMNGQTVAGQGWNKNGAAFYSRLPTRAKDNVRKPVWRLSKHTAGLKLRFRSNSSSIFVRYRVSEKVSKFKMPATGVSGVDLYSYEKGEWTWVYGDFNFGDTIQYRFSTLPGKEPREYHLYLPLHNGVKWLDVGVLEDKDFHFIGSEDQQPIVVYGTSIAQGGAASRPGNAWTAMLGRFLHAPVINLGFLGNGRLEREIVDLLVELEPKLYIIDCLPNMKGFPKDTTAERLFNAVVKLRQAKPHVPILITHHAVANVNTLNKENKNKFGELNKTADSVFLRLQSAKVQDVYLLTSEEIGLNFESTVDGVHPNDYGMWQYAKAYEAKVKDIFFELSKRKF